MADTLTLQDTKFLREVERRSGTRISSCVQCHKCSTGCPVGPEMDLMTSQIMRLICLGQEKEVLDAPSIWLCASCKACSTRCPMGIEIAGAMDTLRIMAVERGIVGDEKGDHFNRAFLTSVRWHGRVHEMGMMTLYKLRSRDLFSDVDKVPSMLKKRKLAFLPHFGGSAKQVRKVFKRAEEEEKKR